MKQRLLFMVSVVLTLQSVYAQAPDGYYNDANGKCGQALRSALESIISKHTERSYSNLWNDFKSTDARSDGKAYDIYSNSTNYIFGTDQIGGSGYSREGDGYNREHSFPKSWFNDGTPMYTDLYHLYPADGFVNGKRSNYPFGEVGTVTYTSNNKYSKLGKASNAGYTGTVFEPADEYKGDLARTYFYMVTCYDSRIRTWSSDMLANGDLSNWAISLLLKWSKNDPVSEKERKRIEAVYKIQHNRNPFIDCPGLEEYIWGSKKTTGVDINTLTGIISVPTDGSLRYHISTASGELKVEAYNDHTPITICDIAGRTIIKTLINKGEHDYQLQKGLYIVGGKKFMIK